MMDHCTMPKKKEKYMYLRGHANSIFTKLETSKIKKHFTCRAVGARLIILCGAIPEFVFCRSFLYSISSHYVYRHGLLMGSQPDGMFHYPLNH